MFCSQTDFEELSIESTYLKSALITIAFFCTLRGLIAIPMFVTSTGSDIWQIFASTVWFYVGICFITGSIK